MSVLDKLGINKDNELFLANDNRNYTKIITFSHEWIVDSHNVSEQEQIQIHVDGRCFNNAPELLEALIEMVISAINNYDNLPNSHRKTVEEYYHDEISIIEKATGKSWQEIKGLMNE